MKTKYQKGDTVVYYQPGINSILDAWSGKGRVRNDGTEKTVTITKVSRDETSQGMQTFYDTDDGVLLTDSDILRLA